MLESESHFAGSGAPARLGPDHALHGGPRLDAWASIDAEAIARLRQHPLFAEALRAFATTVVEFYHGNRLVNMISNDRGRLFLAILALYLHYTGRPDDPASGLTAARLQSLFVETGLGSAGRAKALITLMHWGGYLEPAPASRDRRVRALQPTEEMFAMHRDRWRRALRATGLVLPDAAQACARFDEPGFLRAFAIAQAREFLGGFRPLDHGPDLQLLSDRNAGFPIMFSIMLAAPPPDGMPPTGPIPVSASALAKRFHVSRSHVATLLRDAQAAGLLVRSGTPDMRVRFVPHFIEDFEKLFGSVFLVHAACARYALGEVDAMRKGGHAT